MVPRHPIRLLLVCVLATACGGGEPPPLPLRQPTPLDAATTGTIHGQVRLDGTPPPMQDVRFGSFAECAAQHRGPVPVGDVLVHDGLVENAFVYIQSGLGERVFAIPTTPVEIDQKGCLYHPRVAGHSKVSSARKVLRLFGELFEARLWFLQESWARRRSERR